MKTTTLSYVKNKQKKKTVFNNTFYCEKTDVVWEKRKSL